MAQVVDREAAPLLDEIREVFGLSESELADLFGVRRPSLTAWRSVGIPPGRRATAERLLGLARVLDRELIRSRIPEIVRTPDDWLGNRTILDVLIAEGPAPVYGYLGRLFAYAEGA
ncbi:MAG TPA: helix-turn-helix transcriptional regulator [Candidatus Dormibacteraeota bacterium]